MGKQTYHLSISVWSQAEGKKRKEKEPRTDKRAKGRERGKEKEERSEDLLWPWLNTYWLNNTRERTMNLKMYSKAFMALYSCSLTPGFSALAT